MDITKKDFTELLDVFNIPEIPSEPNYWFIRTESGSFYNIFKQQEYVSIGYDKINLELITDKKDTNIKDIIQGLYPDCKRPGVILSQLKRFKFSVKKGDIIIIPDKNSRNLCIGQATSNVYQVNKKEKQEELDSEIYTYEKRIDTRWFAEIPRNEFDLYIFKLLNSHQAIVSCDIYKDFINRMVFPIYVQNNKMHLALNITKKTDISLENYNSLITMLYSCIDLYNELTKQNLKADLNVKVTANSPGVFEVLGNPYVILGIIIILSIVGGKIKFKYNPNDVQFEISTDGFIEKIKNLIAQCNKDKFKTNKLLIDKAFKELEIKDLSKMKKVKKDKIIKDVYKDDQTSLFD